MGELLVKYFEDKMMPEEKDLSRILSTVCEVKNTKVTLKKHKIKDAEKVPPAES